MPRYFELPGLVAVVIKECGDADIGKDWEEISLSLFKSTTWNKVEYKQGTFKPTVLNDIIQKSQLKYWVHHGSSSVLVSSDYPGDLCEEIDAKHFYRLVKAGYSYSGPTKFIEFMYDKEAWDMYITGPAGTGKTWMVSTEIAPWCLANGIQVTVCAFTHRACEVLASKLPEGVIVKTLHSLLKKRPMINQNATQLQHLQVSRVTGQATPTELIIIDEYGMVGERDLQDLRLLQDPGYEATPKFKVLWLGDPNQLPPVGDVQGVRPEGKYQIRLRDIKRTSEQPLLSVLAKLVSYIEGKDPAPLGANECFIRGTDIVKQPGPNDVLLAYTNKRVQELNSLIAGRTTLKPGDILFSPTTHKNYTYWGDVERPDSIMCPFSGELHRGSKYRTLEYIEDKYSFAEVRDEEDNTYVVAYIFGHSDYNIKSQELKTEAANSNLAIEQQFKGYKAAPWAKANSTHKLARARSKAWRDFLGFDECVICLDFPFARTVHKSQGSTFDNVYLDMDDLYQCAERDFKLYLRLLYVAISRARYKVFTN